MSKRKHLIMMLHVFFSCYAVSEINLRLYEKRLISQNGEDGVLQKIFDVIGTTNKYYVEFGAGKGHYGSNTKYFREKFGWTGLLLEGSCTPNATINLHRAFITAENICDLFRQHNVPQEFDLISIDIDGNDFYVWNALSQYYKPRVVIIESNFFFNHDEDKVMAYDANHLWDGTEYSGASSRALYNLGRKLGYTLVYHESTGVNLFFIRDDVLEASGAIFSNMNDVARLYNGRPKKLDPYRKRFISSAEALSLYNRS